MAFPNWALRKASIEDFSRLGPAMEKGVAVIKFRDRAGLKQWMSQHGWKKSWFFLEEAFKKQISTERDKLETALNSGIVDIKIPVDRHVVGSKDLNDMDQSYESQEWDSVAGDLRQYVILLKNGVEVEVEGKTFSSAGNFYTWLHKRYPVLEEAVDDWILDAK